MRIIGARFAISALFVSIFCCALCWAQDEPSLTVEQQREFLLNAKVMKYRQTSKGITSPYRLTLSDGKITHDAGFQSVNERKTRQQFSDGRIELQFVDSFLYNLAAYELAKLVGLGDMVPVTVRRKWRGKDGAMSWWLPAVMDEVERTRKKIQPPDPAAWNAQMHKLRVFAELVYDTDRNLGNVVIGKDWKIYMIDFTRAFRLLPEIKAPKNLTRCSRELLESLRKLDINEFTAKTKEYLSAGEVQAVMKRRDKIVAHYEKLVAEKGEKEVLY